MFEWFRRLFRRQEKWVLDIPDGTGANAKLFYEGRVVGGISHISIDLAAGDVVCMTLCVAPMHMRVVMGALALEIEKPREGIYVV